MKDLRGRTAVVTGAGGLIGRALAAALAAEGMRLVLADADEASLAATAETLRAADVPVLTHPTDVSSADAVGRLADAALDRFGAVHVVCNNAGITAAGRVWECPADVWDRVQDVNLRGVLNGIRTFVPLLIAQGEGHVVNTASMAGLIAGPGFGAYVVSKHGVTALSECLYRELAEAAPGVGVTVLCPGLVEGGMAPGAAAPSRTAPSPALSPDVQATALSADEVARQAVRAIHARRLWVVLPPERAEAVRTRAHQIVSSTNPPITYGF